MWHQSSSYARVTFNSMNSVHVNDIETALAMWVRLNTFVIRTVWKKRRLYQTAWHRQGINFVPLSPLAYNFFPQLQHIFHWEVAISTFSFKQRGHRWIFTLYAWSCLKIIYWLFLWSFNRAEAIIWLYMAFVFLVIKMLFMVSVSYFKFCF